MFSYKGGDYKNELRKAVLEDMIRLMKISESEAEELLDEMRMYFGCFFKHDNDD